MLIIFILTWMTKCIKTTCHVFQDLQSWVMKEKIGNPSNGERQNMMRWSCESEGEIWSVIALGFIFVDKVPLWWIHQRGISHEPKDGDDVPQSITSIYLQGQRVQEEWCSFQYHRNVKCITKFSVFVYLCQLSWTSKGFSSSPSLRSPDSWISYKAYSGTCKCID